MYSWVHSHLTRTALPVSLAGQVFYILKAMAYVEEERCELGGGIARADGVLSVLEGVHKRKERGARCRSRKPLGTRDATPSIPTLSARASAGCDRTEPLATPPAAAMLG